MALSPVQSALATSLNRWFTRESFIYVGAIIVSTMTFLGNSYGQGLPPDTDDTDTVQISNAYLMLRVVASGTHAGRWLLKTTGGNPLTTKDNNKPVLTDNSGGYGSRTLIKVGETVPVEYGAGTWSQPPTADDVSDVITSVEDIGATASLRITRKMSLIRDLLRIEYTVNNIGTVAQRVGLANWLDTSYGEDQIPNIVAGGPFYALTLGSITRERAISSSLPDVIYGFDNLPDYGFPTQTILRGIEDVSTPNSALMVVGNQVISDPWSYTIRDFLSILEDSALVLLYNQQSVAPGGQLAKLVTYHGLAQATTQPLYPVAAALQAPFSVKYTRSSTDTVGKLAPEPITVTGYIYNQNKELKQENVQAILTLGDGLEFMPTELPIKTVGTVGAGQEEIVTWEIRATSSVVGPISFTMSVAGSLMAAKSVSRTINVPATERTVLPQSKWRLISVPFKPDNSAPAAIFNLPFNSFVALRWNAESGAYDSVTDVQPGAGFWLKSFADANVTLQDVLPLANSNTDPYIVTLSTGWNLFGNPYLYSIPLGRFRFLKSTSETSVSFDEAVKKNWIRGTVYSYDSASGQYLFSSSSGTQIVPWQGYWIKALTPVTLIVPPVETIDAGVSFSEPADGGGGNNGGGGPPPPPPGGLSLNSRQPLVSTAGLLGASR